MHHDIQDFRIEVVEASRDRPVVVDFWAEWCAPCQILGPVLEKLAAGSGDRWRLAKVDTERFPEAASRYGVSSIPNVKLFVDGVPVGEFVGALPESQVIEWLKRTLPSEVEREVARVLGLVRECAKEGRSEEARVALEAALAGLPEEPRLRLELARIVVFEDPVRARALVEGLGRRIADEKVMDAILRFIRLLDSARGPGEDSEEAGPNRCYGEAIERLRERDFVSALERLLDVLRTGSGRIREEAGGTCTALFHCLGPSHPAVTRFRSEVAGALYR